MSGYEETLAGAKQYRDEIVAAVAAMGHDVKAKTEGYDRNLFWVKVKGTTVSFQISLTPQANRWRGGEWEGSVVYNNLRNHRSRDRHWLRNRDTSKVAANIIVKETAKRAQRYVTQRAENAARVALANQSRAERDRVLAEVGDQRHKLVWVYERDQPGTLRVEVTGGRMFNTPMYCSTEGAAGFVTELSALLAKYNITTGYTPDEEEED